MFLSQANRFRFGLKILGQKQSNLIWSGNCLGQNRTLLYNPQTYRSKQNVLIWSTYYRNESKTFQSVPKLFKIELERFGVFSSKMKQERNRANFLYFFVNYFPGLFFAKLVV